MTNSVTHFEIYGEEPAKLADFYRNVFGWQVEQMPGVNYWRIQIGSAEPKALHGGLTYRAIPDLNGWMLFVNVASIDDTVTLVQKLGGSIVRPKTAVPKTAWVTIVADPAKTSSAPGRRILAPFLYLSRTKSKRLGCQISFQFGRKCCADIPRYGAERWVHLTLTVK